MASCCDRQRDDPGRTESGDARGALLRGGLRHRDVCLRLRSAPHLRTRTGFARYDDGPSADAALDQLLHATGRADERVDKALAWLRRERTKPFFLWLHLFDPHAPYDPPEGFRARYAGRPYDGEVAFVDTQIARLLAALERSGHADNTLVVLLSDHGKSLGEHAERTHGVLLYDATLRVPLIVRLPGKVGASEVRHDPVTLADVVPTVVALSGLPAAPGIDGRDLFGPEESPPPGGGDEYLRESA